MVEAVRDYVEPFLGMPYSFGEGTDCVEIIRRIYARMGIVVPKIGLPSYRRLSEVPLERVLEIVSLSGFTRVDVFEPGNLLIFYDHARRVFHVGILLDNEGNFFHSMEERGCSIHSLRDKPWTTRLHSVFRHRERA